MGAGTAVVEAMVLGRRVIGCDLNSLAVFVTRVKTTPLTARERAAVEHWADTVVSTLSFRRMTDLSSVLHDARTKNLQIPRARPFKKFFAQALLTVKQLPTNNARAFVRCALLNLGQWALNGRRQQTSLSDARARLSVIIHDMLKDVRRFEDAVAAGGGRPPTLINARAAELPDHSALADGLRGDLVVTSPPYPGIHVVYHRWQVDGRRETPAPYWIAACRDGQGSAFYNFADRREETYDRYFRELANSFSAVRRVVRPGALVLQLVAFSSPRIQLPRYLEIMTRSGFDEVRADADMGDRRHHRIWRHVPGRHWHASMKGALPSAREVVLIHRARH